MSFSGSHANIGIITKSMVHVEMAKYLIQCLIDRNSNQIPHKSRTTLHGTHETQGVLPSMYKQADILHEVSETLLTLEYKKYHNQHCQKNLFSKMQHCTI